MFKKIIFSITLVAFALISGDTFSSEPPSLLIIKGDSYFSKRSVGHVGNRAKTINVLKAIASYESAYDPKNPSSELLVKLMRAYYFYIAYAEKNSMERKETLRKAIKTGEKALKKFPNNVGINYWLGAFWGRWVEVNGIFASARMGVADRVRHYAERTIELDPYYADGGGYRTFGILHVKAPVIPFLLPWPSKKEGVKYLAKAVEVGPENLSNHVYYGEGLIKIGQTKKALGHLEKVLNAKIRPDKLVEELQDKQEAKKLLKELRDSDVDPFDQ